jgi:hypothetical protein
MAFAPPLLFIVKVLIFFLYFQILFKAKFEFSLSAIYGIKSLLLLLCSEPYFRAKFEILRK